MMPHLPKSRLHLHRETRQRRADAPDDDVELNSDDSFPASDPPSWTPVARIGKPKQSPSSQEF